MTANKADAACVLFWDVSHLGDDDFDATLVKFPDWHDTINLVPPFTYELPSDIHFEANFRTLKGIDYPYTDVRWPIMSERMRDALTKAGKFAHELVPVTMIDDTVPGNKRRTARELSPEVTRHVFAAVKLLDALDIFDWEKSKYDKDPDFPKFASNVKRWVLKRPKHGFPPIFRVCANPTLLFASATAREALERGMISGIEFQDVVDIVA